MFASRILIAILPLMISCCNGFNLTSTYFDGITNSSEFSTKTDVKYLHFHEVNIESIAEDALWDFPNLKIFYVIGNPIAEIPRNLLKNSGELRLLSIVNNSVAALHPDTFAAQTGLIQLVLADNLLRAIDGHLFRNNSQLKVLNLGGNRIKSIEPQAFESLVHLRLLHLNGNRLSVLPEVLFAKNLKLEAVFLNGNRIKTLKPYLLENNLNLEELSLAANRLSLFEFEALQNNTKLQRIHLNKNDISELRQYSKVYPIMPDLSMIDLSLNNFNCCYLFRLMVVSIRGHPLLLFTKEQITKNIITVTDLYRENICVKNEDYAAVSEARINAADPEDEDEEKTYAIVAATQFHQGQLHNQLDITRNILKDLESCESGSTDFEFSFFHSCNLLVVDSELIIKQNSSLRS